jgi:hypothetical protein
MKWNMIKLSVLHNPELDLLLVLYQYVYNPRHNKGCMLELFGSR